MDLENQLASASYGVLLGCVDARLATLSSFALGEAEGAESTKTTHILLILAAQYLFIPSEIRATSFVAVRGL